MKIPYRYPEIVKKKKKKKKTTGAYLK